VTIRRRRMHLVRQLTIARQAMCPSRSQPCGTGTKRRTSSESSLGCVRS
jgi:hypothetical protein